MGLRAAVLRRRELVTNRLAASAKVPRAELNRPAPGGRSVAVVHMAARIVGMKR